MPRQVYGYYILDHSNNSHDVDRDCDNLLTMHTVNHSQTL